MFDACGSTYPGEQIDSSFSKVWHDKSPPCNCWHASFWLLGDLWPVLSDFYCDLLSSSNEILRSSEIRSHGNFVRSVCRPCTTALNIPAGWSRPWSGGTVYSKFTKLSAAAKPSKILEAGIKMQWLRVNTLSWNSRQGCNPLIDRSSQ